MGNNPFKDVLRRHAGHTAGAGNAAPDAPVPPSAAERLKLLQTLEQENADTAKECVAAGLVTQAQCALVEKQVKKLTAQNEPARFEEVAVQMGYCNRVQVAELQEELRSRALLKDRYVPSPKIYNRKMKEGIDNKLTGSRMIAAGLITPAQRERVVEKQQKLAMAGAKVRFGEMAVQLGFLSQKELDAFIDAIKKREEGGSW